MFYNRRSSERVWPIGEILFDPGSLEIISRGDEPLITPTAEIGWQDQRIAFASGVVRDGGALYLYYHEADRRVRCAVGTLPT